MSAACSKKHVWAHECPLYGSLVVTKVPPWKNGPADQMLDLRAYSRAHDATAEYRTALGEFARSQKRGQPSRVAPARAPKPKKHRNVKPLDVLETFT